MSVFTSVISALLVFSIIVIVHEFGHFIAARKCGVFVEEFAIGMGPKLWGKYSKGTLFSIRLFPIGGYCKMLGESDDGSNDPRAFNSKSLPKRTLIISAGIILNAVLAFVAFLIVVLCSSGYHTTIIQSTLEGFPAREAGVLEGDKITAINGGRILVRDDLDLMLADCDGTPIEVSLMRNGKIVKVTLTPQYIQADNRYMLGLTTVRKTGFFSAEIDGFERAGFFESVSEAANMTVFTVKSVYVGLAQLVTRNVGMDQMMGPIGISGVIGEYVEESISISVGRAVLSVLSIVGALSINLAVFNLLPIPGLDGGRLIFFVVEAVRRKPIDQNKEGVIHFAGFVLLMIFAVFVAAHDIIKFF